MDRNTDSQERLWEHIDHLDGCITRHLELWQSCQSRIAHLNGDCGLDDNERIDLYKECYMGIQENINRNLLLLRARRLELVEEIRRENNYTNRVV